MSRTKRQRELPFHACHILVVDDFQVFRKTIIHVITNALDCDVHSIEASDGVEALAAFAPGKFDVIIMDWKMPRMDGLEAVKNIRSVDVTVPIIMVTTEAQKARVIEAVKSGVNDYLIKPFKHDELVEKVAKWVTASVFGGNELGTALQGAESCTS